MLNVARLKLTKRRLQADLRHAKRRLKETPSTKRVKEVSAYIASLEEELSVYNAVLSDTAIADDVLLRTPHWGPPQ